MFRKETIIRWTVFGRFMGLALLLLGSCMYVNATILRIDGDKKKDAKKEETPAHLTYSNLKNTLQLSLRPTTAPGFLYKGNIVTEQQSVNSIFTVRSLMTYQKGNTIYILPYKQQFLLSKFKTPERDLK